MKPDPVTLEYCVMSSTQGQDGQERISDRSRYGNCSLDRELSEFNQGRMDKKFPYQEC